MLIPNNHNLKLEQANDYVRGQPRTIDQIAEHLDLTVKTFRNHYFPEFKRTSGLSVVKCAKYTKCYYIRSNYG